MNLNDHQKIRIMSDRFYDLLVQSEANQLRKVELLGVLKDVRDKLVDWVEDLRIELTEELVEKMGDEERGRVA